MKNVLLVIITAASEEEAAKIGTALVEERLAACANIIPKIRSIYRWEGKVQDEPEVMMLIKTIEGKFDSLQSRVKELHSYTVPEIIAFPISKGSADYLRWVEASTAGSDS